MLLSLKAQGNVRRWFGILSRYELTVKQNIMQAWNCAFENVILDNCLFYLYEKTWFVKTTLAITHLKSPFDMPCPNNGVCSNDQKICFQTNVVTEVVTTFISMSTIADRTLVCWNKAWQYQPFWSYGIASKCYTLCNTYS